MTVVKKQQKERIGSTTGQKVVLALCAQLHFKHVQDDAAGREGKRRGGSFAVKNIEETKAP